MIWQLAEHVKGLRIPAFVEIQGINIPTWVCLAVPSAAITYGYLRYKADRLRRNGIPGPRGNILIGSLGQLLSKGVIKFDQELQEYGEVAGFMLAGNTTAVNVYNLDMIRDILIKDFDCFTNHTDRGANEIYPLRKMITVLRDEHWKHVRNTLTPTFSGGKLRRMIDAINKCCRTWNTHLAKNVDAGEILEMKTISGYLTMDLIASTVFGMDIDSANDPQNDFVRNAEAIMGFAKKINIKILLFFTMPRLMTKLGIHIFPKDSVEFLIEATKKALKFHNQDSKKKDFVQILVDSIVGEPTEDDMKENGNLLKSNKGHVYSKSGLTMEEVLASAIIFFLAGFDTVATALSFLCYNLACNPHIQDKLHQEIVRVLEQGEPDYDMIKRMPYLQMCVEESMRIYPPAIKTERNCNKDVIINGHKFEKGMTIGIPVWCIHHNPDIYPNHDQFIPERFAAEAKANRHPMAYLPFGQGPRACIAMRLALVEVKFAIINLLREFRIVTCEQTQIPLKLSKLRMAGEDGIKLKLERR